jgi:hypothetical protein
MFFPLVLGKTKQENGSIGADSDQHAKAASLALSRPRHPLLDDVTTKISINQTSHGIFDGGSKAVVADAVLSGKPRKSLGFENSHHSTVVLKTIVHIITKIKCRLARCPGQPRWPPRGLCIAQSTITIGSGI